MISAKLDEMGRLTLPHGRPGEVYEIRQEGEGRMLLVRLEGGETVAGMSRESCLDAMEQRPLRPTMTWEQLRSLTRDL